MRTIYDICTGVERMTGSIALLRWWEQVGIYFALTGEMAEAEVIAREMEEGWVEVEHDVSG